MCSFSTTQLQDALPLCFLGFGQLVHQPQALRTRPASITFKLALYSRRPFPNLAQLRLKFPFHGIDDLVPEHREELVPVPTATRSEEEIRMVGMISDDEVTFGSGFLLAFPRSHYEFLESTYVSVYQQTRVWMKGRSPMLGSRFLKADLRASSPSSGTGTPGSGKLTCIVSPSTPGTGTFLGLI